MVEDVFAVYEDLGGQDYLKKLAESNDKHDRQLWAAIAAKLMPNKIENEVTGSVTIDALIIAASEGDSE